MGPDPIGLRSYGDRLGIVTQAFSEITRDYPRLPEITYHERLVRPTRRSEITRDYPRLPIMSD